MARTLDAHARFYCTLLDTAKHQGALPAELDNESTAAALLGLVVGMRVLARGGASGETLRALRRQADTLVKL